MIHIPRVVAVAALISPVPVTAAVTPTTISGPGTGPASWAFPAGDTVAWRAASGATWAASATAGVWSPPSAVSPRSLAGLASGGGSTLVATADVTGNFAFEVREAGAAGAWTVIPGLEGRTAREGLALALNARGEALVAWVERIGSGDLSRVFVAWRRPGQAWSAPKRLGGRYSFGEGDGGVRAALDDSGRGTVVWSPRGRRTAAVGVVFGRWAAPRRYGTGSAKVVAAGNRTLVTWVAPDQHAIRAATMGAFRLAPPRTVLTVPAGIFIADVYPAVAADGSAVVAYTPQRVRRTGTTVRRAAITRTPAGAWSRPVPLSAAAPLGFGLPWTTSSVAGDGALTVAWRRAGRVEARTGRIGQPWGPVIQLGTGSSAALPLAAPSPAAGARITWVDRSGAVQVADLPSP